MKGTAELALVRRVVGLDVARVPLQHGRATLALPRCQDALLDLYIEQAAAFEHRVPYYGVVWPSAIALAREAASAVRAGDSVLELGSGVGLGGIGAALTCSPSSVTLTDLDPAAARLGRFNARLSGVSSLVRYAALDWTELDSWPRRAFDCAIAADVIYEEAACRPIARVLARTLRPGGRFLLADGKGRVNRDRLKSALENDGAFVPSGSPWHVTLDASHEPQPQPAQSSPRDAARDSSREQNVVLMLWERTDTDVSADV